MMSEEVAWHDERRARIRKAHPEVRKLYGHDPRSQLAALGLVGAQFGVAYALKKASWGPWLGATWVVGPTLAHAMGVLIHEATHNLMAKNTRANKVWSLFLNLPLGAPAAMEFRAQHLIHHRHLGDVDPATGQDTQAPLYPEDEWVGTSPVRKLASFTFGRFFWKGRAAAKVPFDAWMMANWVTSFGAIVLVGFFWGTAPTLYLLVSSVLAFGPHTFGARRLSEHLPVRAGQPTNSYYGPLNAVSFNVGYHVEHHDFPNIPWSKLKKLQQLAGAEYTELFAFRSWTKLIVSYFTDARYRVRHYIGLAEPLGEDVVAGGAGDPCRVAKKPTSGFFSERDPAQQKPHRAA